MNNQLSFELWKDLPQSTFMDMQMDNKVITTHFFLQIDYNSAEEKQCTNAYVTVMKEKKYRNFKNTTLEPRLELFIFKIIQAKAIQKYSGAVVKLGSHH